MMFSWQGQRAVYSWAIICGSRVRSVLTSGISLGWVGRGGAGGTTLLIWATFDIDIVQSELIGAIQRILVRLGTPPQLLLTTSAVWAAGSAGPETSAAVLLRRMVYHRPRECSSTPSSAVASTQEEFLLGSEPILSTALLRDRATVGLRRRRCYGDHLRLSGRPC